MLAAGRQSDARRERAHTRLENRTVAARLLLPAVLVLLAFLASRLAPPAEPEPGWYLIGLDDEGRSWHQSGPFATAAECSRELDGPRGAEREDRAALLAALDERQAQTIQECWARADALDARVVEVDRQFAAGGVVGGDDLTWRCVPVPDPATARP
jgi:hypothetical protein